MLLSLPTLAPTIPTKIEFGGVGLRHLSLVLALSRLGLVSETQFASLSQQSLTTSALNALIETALRSKFGELFDFQVLTASTTLEVSSNDGNTDHYHSNTLADTSIPFIADANTSCEWVRVGPFLLELDALEPGLGRLCLVVMDRLLCWFGYPHTPSGVMDMARDWCWYGEDDETTALAELTEEGSDPNDLDIVRRKDLIDGVPEWAYECHAKPDEWIWKTTDLPALASKHINTKFGAFLAQIAFIAETLERRDEIVSFYEDGMALFPPVVLCWDDKDQYDCVIDDVHDREMQSGEGAPWAWVIEMGLSEGEIGKGIGSICETGRVLKALDLALSVIKEYEQ